jgi:N-acetylneuraminate synthase/N,N'-diacetyllegionaminate synthase
MRKVKIGNRLVGDGEPAFVVAEVGVNHNGNLGLALKLVDTAKEAGADGVKFQTWKTEEIVTEDVAKPKYQKTSAGQSQYEMLKKLELSDDVFRQVAEYSRSIGITFLSTPEGEACTDFIDELGVPAFKIGSADLTNHPHLTYIAKKKKPIILSTGMATLEEVKEAVKVIESTGNNKIILLHCTSNYPASLESVNLRAMTTLKKEFRVPIGYSDHTIGIGVAIMATLLGASVIEKHFTLNKEFPGPDHKASLEPPELKEMIKGIRVAERNRVAESTLGKKMREISTKVAVERKILEGIERILGQASKKPTRSEEEMIRLARKYIVAKEEIRKGEVITSKMLAIKRSGGGLEPKHLDEIIGKKAKMRIGKDETVTFDKVV